MDINSKFDERYSIRVGKRGENRHNKYVQTSRVDPPEGASSVFWAEFDRSGEATGVSGKLVENWVIPLTGSYLRRCVREAYGREVEFLGKNRGRYMFDIRLPDGSIA